MNVGDKVQVTEESFFTFNKIGRVIEIHRGVGLSYESYTVEFPDKSRGLLFENELRIVEYAKQD